MSIDDETPARTSLTVKLVVKSSTVPSHPERHEALARPDQLFVPDVRSTNLTVVCGIQQAHLFHWMTEAELQGSAPNDVRDAYDIARNLFLYSWFQYRFSMVAAQQAISAVEMALRARFGMEGLSIKTKNGGDKTLRPLLAEAVNRGWITDKGFGVWLPPSRSDGPEGNSYSENLKDILPKIRNWLAHGTNSFSDQGQMKDFIGRSGAMIDQLFPKK